MARLKKYALYKGDELIAEGTIEQIATKMGIPQNTVRFYKAHHTRGGTIRRTAQHWLRLITMTSLKTSQTASPGLEYSRHHAQH